MSEPARSHPKGRLVDDVALAIQGLRRRDGGFDQLVRLDHRAEEEAAPYQFDASRGRLHRRGCRWIMPDAPLYARTRVGPDDLQLACPKCMPMSQPTETPSDSDRAAILYGLLSLVDQFAGVLRERGRDYQRTPAGQRLGTQLSDVYANLGAQERQVVDALVTLLEHATARLRKLDDELRSTQAEGSE